MTELIPEEPPKLVRVRCGFCKNASYRTITNLTDKVQCPYCGLMISYIEPKIPQITHKSTKEHTHKATKKHTRKDTKSLRNENWWEKVERRKQFKIIQKQLQEKEYEIKKEKEERLNEFHKHIHRGKTTCTILKNHKKLLGNDPDHLTTEFIKNLSGINKSKCKGAELNE